MPSSYIHSVHNSIVVVWFHNTPIRIHSFVSFSNFCYELGKKKMFADGSRVVQLFLLKKQFFSIFENFQGSALDPHWGLTALPHLFGFSFVSMPLPSPFPHH